MTDRDPAEGRRSDSKDAEADSRLGSSPAGAASPRPVGSRRERYLVAAPEALPIGMSPFDGATPGDTVADRLFAQLEADPAVAVHRIIEPTARPGGSFPRVAVVEMEADLAAMLDAVPAFHVEPDLPLQYAGPTAPGGKTFPDPGVMPLGDEVPVTFAVFGSDGKAIEGAEVYLMSEAFPLRTVTGDDGTAVVDVPAAALPALTGVYVKPRYDYWAVWLGRPQLCADAPNLISCPSLAETFPGFPQRRLDGWARRAMRFDALPPIFRGDGVRIAIIDSGAAADHPDLNGRVTAGRDILDRCGDLPAGQSVHDKDDAAEYRNGGRGGWRFDTVGHGTHAAGIIGGTDNGGGMVGVVPEAELHACKIFPGGRFSDLIEALDYCVAHRVDVVNLSLGSPQPSPLIARKIEEARQAGVACVAAAGNSGGPVRFPASMPTVLAVAAIGKVGEYPPESYHATQVYGVPTVDGYFSAAFTCHGPEIDVCAPGVAIVSSVPPTNYAAWDGTSFATPYVTGLAALLLAHHPEFRERFVARDATRVDRLFDLIRASCRPLPLGDPGRGGAGLPDAVAALGLTPPVATTPPTHPDLAELWGVMARAGLIPLTVPTVPSGWPSAAPPTSAPWTFPGYAGTPAHAGVPAGMAGPAGPAGMPAHTGVPAGMAGPAGAPRPAPMSGTAASGVAASGVAASGVAASGVGRSGSAGMSGTPSGTPDTGASAPLPGATLTPPSSDALDPLRTAMRAAGLLPRHPAAG